MSSPASPSSARPLSSTAPPTSSPPTPGLASAPAVPSSRPELDRVLSLLGQMSEDASLPRNIRRGAQGAREALLKNGVAVDVRVAGAVGVLDDLANDSNIPVHGRTAIWSLISQLESLQ